MRRKGFWFALAVAIQLVVLLGLVGRHSVTLATGTEVTLKSEPYDPWSPLKGEYVRLRYNISTFPAPYSPSQDPVYQRGDVVWVTLKEGAPFWTAVAIGKEQPAPLPDEVAVRGRVDWVQLYGEKRENVEPGFEHGQVNLIFGIEEFYVPEGEGHGLEAERAGITVKAKVDRWGRMALSQVLVNSEPVKWK